MKQTLLTISLFLVSFFCFSQNSTPSKEETIEWINEKLDKYSGYRVKSGDCWIQNDYYTYSSFLQYYLTRSCPDEEQSIEKYEMDFSDICRIWKGHVGTDNGDRPALYLYGCANPKKEIIIYLNWSLEDDLYNRMANAFNDLIKLNKPKETY